MNKVIYLCNGKREGCTRTGCGLIQENRNKDCIHTLDEKAALYGPTEDPAHEPDRFRYEPMTGDWIEIPPR